MSNATLVQVLDRWTGSQASDRDSFFLAKFLTERDEEAFAALVHRHGPLVYGTCLRILGNRCEADDAFQAVFFVLARRAETLQPDRGIGPWLHGVTLRIAKKLRTQLVQRRLRDMSAAKSERVEAPEPARDFWEIIDAELARMSLPLREVLLLCDLSGQSHSQAAESLGLAKGTVTKRLAKARDELAARLKRRGITLGAGALTATIAEHAAAAVPAPLLQDTVAFSVSQVGGSASVKSLADEVMRSFKLGALKVWLELGLIGLVLTGGGLMLAARPADPVDRKDKSTPPAAADAKVNATKLATMWKETYTVDYRGSLPVSVAFSADGKTLLTGDTNGEVMALTFARDSAGYRWKSKAGGSHAAVAFSSDQKKVYATTEHGVRILDAANGKEEALIEAKDSNPIAIGVFLDKIGAKYPQVQIVFGNARGYFVKSWADGWGKPTDTMSTIQTNTVAKDAKPLDVTAVPLAVDPKGRSAIMTGPLDGKNRAGRGGKNVLWAYVCGDYEKDSPGTRVMEGHTATVVSAAWAKEGGTAVTGDADGRVIVWDAKTMKETRRIELGGRVVALAISDDGLHTAASVRIKGGADVLVWETAKPTNAMKPIFTQQADFSFEPGAGLSFSPDGKRLAGCMIDKKRLQVFPHSLLEGKVHVWQLTAEPKGQLPPKHAYTKALPKGASSNFVILHDNTMIRAATKEGAVDFVSVADGGIQMRLLLGKFTIGKISLSSDRKWLAMEQHVPVEPNTTGVPSRTFDVGVWDMASWKQQTTIPSCEQMLNVASGGKVVAVARDKQIEVWDVATAKKLKAAPFKHTRIDVTAFSPDGKLLAIVDRTAPALWFDDSIR